MNFGAAPILKHSQPPPVRSFRFLFRAAPRLWRPLLLLVLLLLGRWPEAIAGADTPPRPAALAVSRVVLDSLRHLLALPQTDYDRVLLLCQVSDQLWTQRTDSAAVYARQALALARRVGYRRGEGEALNRLGAALRESNLALSLELFQQSMGLARTSHDQSLVARNLRSIGIIHVYLRDRRAALGYYFQALKIDEQLHDQRGVVLELSNIGLAYDLFGQLDSAQLYQGRALALARQLHTPTNYILYGLGNEARRRGEVAQARVYYRQSITESKKVGHLRSLNFAYVGLAQLYQQLGQLDSSIYFARLGCQAGRTNGFLRGVLNASTLLTQDFRRRGPADSALKYQSLLLVMKDTLFGQEKVMQLQRLHEREQQRAQQAAASQAALRMRYRTLGLVAGVVGLLVLAIILARHGRQQERAREALEKSLAELKTAQAQLVQREKMAFLGELTAGIAHELQNPLTFMKNFAEVSTDLVNDINGEHREAARSSGLEAEILAGLKQNLQQISQHGQRATSIIKGMLEHSRTGTGERETVNLNTLVSDSLRLAHQGLRTKDKEFEVELVKHLAPDLPHLSVVPLDMGRVFINLFTNAFHAVQQRQRQLPAGATYRPKVTVTTLAGPGGVEVRIADNGTGMPASVQAKIFQPFFTTKAVGEGTGLGLSLSHDVVTTGHGGTLTVTSREGEGTEFVISLPA